jgi:selenocysteine-specific elongation factor
MPIDHAFSIKGHGTVVTGTILRGRINLDDEIELMPQMLRGTPRSIQTFGHKRTHAQAGDRVGLNLPEFNHRSIFRGSYLCETNTLRKAANVVVRVNRNHLYHGPITKKMLLSAMIGMREITAQIIPIDFSGDAKIIIDETNKESFTAVLMLNKPIAVEKGMNTIIMRTDLSPTSMRILGSGVVKSILEKVILCRRKTRRARISRIRDNDVLIEGLASRKKDAERLQGQHIHTRTDHVGVLGVPFGTKGVLTAVFKEEVNDGDEVLYTYLTQPEEHKFGV